MPLPKTICTSCGEIIDESDDEGRPDPAWKINDQPKCKDCYLELVCGRIVAPQPGLKPAHQNLTPRQREKLN
jgi:hypothetical protein